MAETRTKLEEARRHALELIYDTEKYFYPYKPPEVSPEKARLYGEVQLEVDRRVDAVRDIWGREHSAFEGASVSLSRKTGQLIDRLHRVRDMLHYFAGEIETDERLADAFLLPRGERSVHVRNYARDVDERKRLDQDVKVRILNATVDVGQPGELAQLRITNDYRQMMGRRRMAFNAKVHAAARWHADWMGRTGIFGHFEEGEPERRTPGDRMKKEGYDQGAGENCAISGSPSQAHYSWTQSSRASPQPAVRFAHRGGGRQRRPLLGAELRRRAGVHRQLDGLRDRGSVVPGGCPRRSGPG